VLRKLSTIATAIVAQTPRGRSTGVMADVDDSTIQCAIAQRKESLRRAFGLIYETYLRHGLVGPNRLGLRILPHQLLETSWVLVATRGRDIVGTLSVIENGALGLPVESLYPKEITQLCRRARHIAELTCLATTGVVGTQSMPVLRELLRAAIRLSALRQIDCFTICIHPRHAPIYTQRLGFYRLGPLRSCPWVRDQPAIALSRELSLPNDANSDLTLSAPSFRPIEEEPGPASRACRAYFQHMLEEASPIPLVGCAARAA
jgi:hypothetical protein